MTTEASKSQKNDSKFSTKTKRGGMYLVFPVTVIITFIVLEAHAVPQFRRLWWWVWLLGAKGIRATAVITGNGFAMFHLKRNITINN